MSLPYTMEIPKTYLIQYFLPTLLIFLLFLPVLFTKLGIPLKNIEPIAYLTLLLSLVLVYAFLVPFVQVLVDYIYQNIFKDLRDWEYFLLGNIYNVRQLIFELDDKDRDSYFTSRAFKYMYGSYTIIFAAYAIVLQVFSLIEGLTEVELIGNINFSVSFLTTAALISSLVSGVGFYHTSRNNVILLEGLALKYERRVGGILRHLYCYIAEQSWRQLREQLDNMRKQYGRNVSLRATVVHVYINGRRRVNIEVKSRYLQVRGFGFDPGYYTGQLEVMVNDEPRMSRNFEFSIRTDRPLSPPIIRIEFTSAATHRKIRRKIFSFLKHYVQ